MQITDITPHRYHYHPKSGRKASIYGAAPWHSEAERTEWQTVVKGYSLHCLNGTTTNYVFGQFLETEQQAIEAANRINDERRAAYLEHAKRWPETAEDCKQRAANVARF